MNIWTFLTGRKHDLFFEISWKFANPEGELEWSEEMQTSGDFIPATLHAKPKAVSSDDLYEGE